jgi:hypothetical protein
MRPWEKRDGETARAYAAFLAYRDMGPERSVVGAYRVMAGREKAVRPPGYWKGWAERHSWTFRADQFDAHLLHLADSELKRRVGAKMSQWGALVDGLLAAVAKELRRRIAMLDREDLDERAISSLGSIAQSVDIALKADRLVSGEAVEKLDHAVGRHAIDPRTARDELLRRLDGIAAHADALEVLRPKKGQGAPPTRREPAAGRGQEG